MPALHPYMETCHTRMCLGRNSEIINVIVIVTRQENIADKLTFYPSPSIKHHIYEGVCLENAYIGHFMFIGVVIIQDRKALNAFYVLMSQDGGRDPAILSARQYFGNFYRMAVELFRSLLFLCLQSALSSTIFRDLFFQC